MNRQGMVDVDRMDSVVLAVGAGVVEADEDVEEGDEPRGVLFYLKWSCWYSVIASIYLGLFAVAYWLAFAFRYDF
ncbi:MAG: hypothetical protein LBL39_04665, partial [Planctomycetaceae bacterium]|nr:hypothetical protein [Planctomycetaceae bacterium]